MKLSDEAKSIFITGSIVGGLVLFFCARRKGPDPDVVGFGPRAPIPSSRPGFNPGGTSAAPSPSAPTAAPSPSATTAPRLGPTPSFMPPSGGAPMPSPATVVQPGPTPSGAGSPNFAGPAPTFAFAQTPGSTASVAPAGQAQPSAAPLQPQQTAAPIPPIVAMPTFELVPEDRTASAQNEAVTSNSPFAGIQGE